MLRRAANPVKGRVELFAEKRLKDRLQVDDGDEVILTLVGE